MFTVNFILNVKINIIKEINVKLIKKFPLFYKNEVFNKTRKHITRE